MVIISCHILLIRSMHNVYMDGFTVDIHADVE